MASAMALSPAGATELVRSSQKDRFYSGYLSTLIADTLNPFIPQRYWLRWQREIQLFAELIYYGLTTVKGNQTLGEEYTNTVQVVQDPSSSRYTVPGVARRTLAILAQIFGRYLIEKFLEKCSDLVTARRLPVALSDSQYRILTWITTNSAELVSATNQLHLALFYLRGLYHSLGKRLAAIHYLMVQYDKMATPTNPYKLLGWLLMIQVMYKLGTSIWKIRSNNSTNSENHYMKSDINTSDNKVSATLKCALCLEPCCVPTATPCGHVMCWVCCAEWVRDKLECPLCRTRLEPRQLTPLQHFEKQS